jgi:putative transposase
VPTQTVLARPLAALLASSGPEPQELQDELLSLARRHLKTLLETSLDLELTRYLGCGHHDRAPTRQGYRNGYYTRDLVTGLGLLEQLRVPRSRQPGFQPSLFARYQRRHQVVDQFIRTLFFLGVSSRDVQEAVELLLGFTPSAQAVSAIVRQLDAQVQAYHQRALPTDVRYLFLDAVTMTVKEAPHAVKRLVLVAYGITQDGRRVLLDYRVAHSESEGEWGRFLTSLWERGLREAVLRLITTDGGAGVQAALSTVFGEVPHQRCWAHKLRNLAGHLKKAQQAPCLAQAQEIYRAKNRRAALQAWKRWRERWESVAPAAVACLRRDLEALLTFLTCPVAHQRIVRTTNYIERLFREVRRRTRLMGAFANKASCDRLLYGVLTRIDAKWSQKPLVAFTQPS